MTTEKVDPTRLVRAKVDHPLHPAIRQVILATYGPPAVIADVFNELAGADAVVLFGSWAARYAGVPGRTPNDIDVLVTAHPTVRWWTMPPSAPSWRSASPSRPSGRT